jgi:hypothetical protein
LLCSHVVEHISDSTLNQLISDVSLASKQETRIIFLFQFVTDSFFKSENTKISEFYLHSINSEIAPNSHGYRTTVSSDQFDELVAQPAVGQIPVRAINIGQIKLSATSIYPLLVPTDTLRPFSDFGLRAQGVIAYASHLRDHAGTPLIGDAIAWFEKAP